MPCCQEVKALQVEELKASVANFGFDAAWTADLVAKWGDDVLSVVVEALRNGFSKDLVLEVLQRFGPLVLEILVGISNKFSMHKQAGIVVGEDVTNVMNASVVETLVQKYLPLILEKYGDKIAQLVVEWLLENVFKK